MSTKRPVTPHDLFRFRPVSDPQISPDGTLVAYAVDTVDLEKNKGKSSIWVAPVSGGAPRPLTNPVEGSDRTPRWSPDGSQVAFISDRKGKSQIWVIDAAGGEARCIETEQRPAGEPVWSPDGSRIAFTANVFDKPEEWEPYPGAPEGDRKRAEEAAGFQPNGDKHNGKQPSDVKVITRLKFRMDGVGYYGDKRNHLFVVPADGSAKAKQVSSGDFDQVMPAWTPDGKGLICSALRRADADYFNRSDIWRFDVETGEATLIYENAGPAHAAKLSPDGRYLLFAGHEAGATGSSTTSQLLCVGLKDGVAQGKAISLTARLDRPIGPAGTSDMRSLKMFTHQWSADSKGVYFLLGDRGESHLFFAPADGGPATRVTRGEERTVVDFSVAPNGTAALLVGDGVTPDELCVLQNGVERRLSGHNDAVAAELSLVRSGSPTRAPAAGSLMAGSSNRLATSPASGTRRSSPSMAARTALTAPA